MADPTTDLLPVDEASILARLDEACDGYACGCLHHRAARVIRRLQGDLWRQRQGAQRLQQRLHDLRAVAVALHDHACHHPDCVARDLPAWEAHRCTCGLHQLRQQYRTVMFGGGR